MHVARKIPCVILQWGEITEPATRMCGQLIADRLYCGGGGGGAVVSSWQNLNVRAAFTIQLSLCIANRHCCSPNYAMALFSDTKVSQQRDGLITEPTLSFEEGYSDALKKHVLPYVNKPLGACAITHKKATTVDTRSWLVIKRVSDLLLRHVETCANSAS